MQNKDDSHRPCFALFRRVGTLPAVQFKDILSRRCASLSPKGKAFSLGTCVPLSPKGESYSAEWENFLPYNLKISSLDAARHPPRRGKLFLSALACHSPRGEKLLRRVGTLLAVQFKDVLSRHLRATLPEGESFFSMHLRATLPEEESAGVADDRGH